MADLPDVSRDAESSRVIRTACCDARALPWPTGFFHAAVCSPPFFGLRKYTNNPAEIGAELTPAAYVESLVAVGREVGVTPDSLASARASFR